MKIIEAIFSVISAIYYVLIILPSSLLSKGSKGRKLFQFDKKPGGTYFHERNHSYGKSDFEKG